MMEFIQANILNAQFIEGGVQYNLSLAGHFLVGWIVTLTFFSIRWMFRRANKPR